MEVSWSHDHKIQVIDCHGQYTGAKITFLEYNVEIRPSSFGRGMRFPRIVMTFMSASARSKIWENDVNISCATKFDQHVIHLFSYNYVNIYTL